MGRILGLDYGKKRIGVAITDPLGIIAQPFETWQGLSRQGVIEQIRELIQGFGVVKIVIGLPLSLSGNKSRMTLEVERFAKILQEKIEIPVVFWDERLSSVESQRAMHAMELKPSRDKGMIDRIAASILLQSYLVFQENLNLATDREDD
ncbi:Holliday junction resolvase RuvX [bacterium]|nr:Holliday junction resolvase RuvX [bacterium]